MGFFILDVNIKYIVFSILYRHINVPMACKELSVTNIAEMSNFYKKLISLNVFPLEEGPTSPTGQFQQSLDSLYDTDSPLSVTNIADIATGPFK